MRSKGPVLRIDTQAAYELFGSPPSSPPLMRSNMSTASTTKLRSSGRLPRRAFFKLKQGTAHVANLVRDGIRRDRLKVSVYDVDQNFDMVSTALYRDAEDEGDAVSHTQSQDLASIAWEPREPEWTQTRSEGAHTTTSVQTPVNPVKQVYQAQASSKPLSSTISASPSNIKERAPGTGVIGRHDGRRNGRIFQVTHLNDMSINEPTLMPSTYKPDSAAQPPPHTPAPVPTTKDRKTLKRSSSEARVDNKENTQSSSSTPVHSLRRKVARIGSERA